ncbi:MAG: low molecular weight protein-tyrosine-phosphatase [Gammaproteobacteria bacterium]|nr:low molecular weight protein-tyrosine-phosphatase [Gammaproteobacteria bacterium]
MEEDQSVKILFVCMGNICRSPTAHGVFRRLVEEAGLTDRIRIDSAGTHAYHVGEPPDARSQAAAARRGVEFSDLRARQVSAEDFERFDYVLAMDRDNLSHLRYMCPESQRAKVGLFLEYANSRRAGEVPDPYFGGDKGFEKVLDLVEAGARGLLEHVRKTHL